TQQHGVVLVLGVVAMLHVGPGKLSEPDGHLDALGTVILRADPMDVLAGPFLPFRGLFPTATEIDSLFKMDMDRVAPTAAAYNAPDLKPVFPAEARFRWAGDDLGCSRNTSGVHAEPAAAIRLDGPGGLVGAGRSNEREGAVPRLGQSGLISRVVAM